MVTQIRWRMEFVFKSLLACGVKADLTTVALEQSLRNCESQEVREVTAASMKNNSNSDNENQLKKFLPQQLSLRYVLK